MSYFIYIIGKRDEWLGSPIKVGITGSLDSRLGSIQTSCPFKIGVISVFSVPDRKTAQYLEGNFHRFHSKRRLSGEWFDMYPIDAVQFMCQSIRSMFVKLPAEDVEKFSEYAGVKRAEQLCASEIEAWRLGERNALKRNETHVTQLQ